MLTTNIDRVIIYYVTREGKEMEEEYYYRIESKSKLSPVCDDYVLIKRREEFLDLCTNTDMFDYYLYDLEDGELIGYDDGLES